MNKKMMYLFNILVMVLIFSHGRSYYAAEGSGANYSVAPKYPDNQQGGKSGYFNLNVMPNKKQTLKIEVKNYSDKENTIYVQMARATTSDGGVISYKKVDSEKSKSLELDIADIVTVKQDSITLPGNGVGEIEVEVNMPVNVFQGVLVGGIHFYQDVAKEENQTVVNTFSYSIPIVLKENDDVVENTFKLLSSQPTLRNYHTYVETTIENSAPIIIKDMIINGSITKKDSNEILYERVESKYQMAPNSMMNFGFDLSDTTLKPGIYTSHILIQTEGKSFKLEKNFEITSKEAEKLNKESVYIEDNNQNSSIILITIIFLLTLLIIILTFFVYKRSKK